MISRSQPLAEEERRLVGFLARDLSHWLTEASKRIETRLVTALSTTLPTCESLDEVARVAVFIIVERLGAEAGMLLIRGESGFRRLAEMGPWSEDDADERERCDLAEACAHAFGPKFHAGNVVAAPVGNTMPTRYVLLLQMPLLDERQSTGFPTLMQAARVLEPHLSARWRSMVLAELLKLGYASLGAPTDAMYAAALSTAVRLVPGADSGSLLVRQDSEEPFVFHAVHGDVPADVIGRSITNARLMDWYGAGDDGWQNGFAKVLQHDGAHTDIVPLVSVEATDAGQHNRHEALADSEPTSGRIQASLCLPVVFDGTVLALLCLENRVESQVFGRDSREIARTARSGSVLSVLLMDMANFKAINDAFGHEAGDEALVAVAHALRASMRDGDYLFRWGGDEFAAILVDETGDLTRSAVERLECAVSAVEVRGQRLQIDVGWAEAPLEGSNADALLRVADERMYANKRKS